MKDWSQNGEQAHILHVFDVLGIHKGHLLDLGAGDGYTMSNTRALLDLGWTGDLYDGDPRGAKDVIKQWITREAIPALVDCRCRFLNMDLDGNDWHILEAVLTKTACVPDLIVVEINPIFQRDEFAVMPYDGAHTWNNNTYYGASLAAFEELCSRFYYRLAYLHAGINAFFIHANVADDHPELIRPIEYKVKFDHRPHPPEKKWIRL